MRDIAVGIWMGVMFIYVTWIVLLNLEVSFDRWKRKYDGQKSRKENVLKFVAKSKRGD